MGAHHVDANEFVGDDEGTAGVAVVGGAVDAAQAVEVVPVGVAAFVGLFYFCAAEPGHGVAVDTASVAVDVAAFFVGEVVVCGEHCVAGELFGVSSLTRARSASLDSMMRLERTGSPGLSLSLEK